MEQSRGTMDVLIEINNGFVKSVDVQDPLGRTVQSEYGIFRAPKDHFNTAIIEMAQCSGLWRMAENEKNPLFTHTFGTGQLIMDALTSVDNLGRIIITVGGSATNDAGFGVAKALGINFDFIDNDCFEDVIPSNCNLSRIKSLDKSSLVSFQQKHNINKIEIIVGCDVDNPLLGPHGATAVYGPQKLSDQWILHNDQENEEIGEYRNECHRIMENNMYQMNEIWKRDLGINVNEMAGSGAAGGLAGALMVYLNARLESGFEIVAKYAGLEDALKGADLVITGEGSIDSSTANGKVPIGVAKHAHKAGISSVVCVAGMVQMNDKMENETNDSDEAMADLIPIAIANRPMSLKESMAKASELISGTVYRIVQLFLHTKCQFVDKTQSGKL